MGRLDASAGSRSAYGPASRQGRQQTGSSAVRPKELVASRHRDARHPDGGAHPEPGTAHPRAGHAAVHPRETNGDRRHRRHHGNPPERPGGLWPTKRIPRPTVQGDRRALSAPTWKLDVDGSRPQPSRRRAEVGPRQSSTAGNTDSSSAAPTRAPRPATIGGATRSTTTTSAAKPSTPSVSRRETGRGSPDPTRRPGSPCKPAGRALSSHRPSDPDNNT